MGKEMGRDRTKEVVMTSTPMRDTKNKDGRGGPRAPRDELDLHLIPDLRVALITVM